MGKLINMAMVKNPKHNPVLYLPIKEIEDILVKDQVVKDFAKAHPEYEFWKFEWVFEGEQMVGLRLHQHNPHKEQK